jgi:hypothetical protein
MVTEKPLSCNSFAKDAAIIPFPSDEVTPPVTKTYLVLLMVFLGLRKSTNSKNSVK